MDTQGTMASISEFKSVKSMNMENPQNIYPTKIKVHMVTTHSTNASILSLDECRALWCGLSAWVASINSVHWKSMALFRANNVSNRVLLEGTVALLRRLVIMLVWCAECEDRGRLGDRGGQTELFTADM